MSEFSLRGGSVGKGTVAAAAGGVKYVVVPLLAVLSATSLLTDAVGEGAVERIGLNDIMGYILILGIPIAVLSFFRGYYPRGSYSRATIGVAVGAMLCLWIWMVTAEGRLDLQFEQFSLTVDFSGFVYLLLLLGVLKIVYYIVEMVSYRKEWLLSREARPAGRAAVR